MRLNITVDDQPVQVEFTLDDFTLQEARLVARELPAAWAAFASGDLSHPDALHALLWIKLRKQYPNLDPDGFDVDFAALVGVGDENPTTGS